MVIDMELDFDASYFDKKEFYKMLNEMTFEETINFLQYNSKYDVIKIIIEDGERDIIYKSGSNIYKLSTIDNCTKNNACSWGE